MITVTFLIAIAVNGLMINPAYLWLIQKLNLGKPFNCVYCLSWWAGIAFALIQAFSGAFSPAQVLVPLAASYLAVALSRWFDNLRIVIK
jgi:hypothetical protein